MAKRYQRGNQNLYVEEGQTTQWPKEGQTTQWSKGKVEKDNLVTWNTQKTEGELRCSETHLDELKYVCVPFLRQVMYIIQAVPHPTPFHRDVYPTTGKPHAHSLICMLNKQYSKTTIPDKAKLCNPWHARNIKIKIQVIRCKYCARSRKKIPVFPLTY
jgi:hypothetical protein